MKKLIFCSFSALLACVLLCGVSVMLTFTSCGDDEEIVSNEPQGQSQQQDDDNPEVSDLASAIIGSWYYYKVNTEQEIEIEVFEFRPGGTGTSGVGLADYVKSWLTDCAEYPMHYTLQDHQLKLTLLPSDEEPWQKSLGDIYIYKDGTAKLQYPNGRAEIPLYRISDGKNVYAQMIELVSERKRESDIAAFNQLVGKWEQRTMEDNVLVQEVGYEFKSDGRCTWYERKYDKDSGILSQETTKSGTFTVVLSHVDELGLSILWTAGSTYMAGDSERTPMEKSQLWRDEAEIKYTAGNDNIMSLMRREKEGPFNRVE
ncbi:MAG: hypothetical protein K6G70_06435 [Bacteroidaceae bacterium]|nr:hypothetical protein [Bacteroidaceae bacterium]